MKYDIFFAGVGGQGILTIGEVLAEVAHQKDIPANFYPSKGMAQRGGFVKAQLRLGREDVGPNIPQRGADMVIAMEPSESLKAIPYIKPGGDFVLYADVWAPTAVSLGKAPYPAMDKIEEQVRLAGARFICIDPATLPQYQGEPVHPNIFLLGIVMSKTGLGEWIDPKDVERTIQTRFRRGQEANLFAYQAGLGTLQEAA